MTGRLFVKNRCRRWGYRCRAEAGNWAADSSQVWTNDRQVCYCYHQLHLSDSFVSSTECIYCLGCSASFVCDCACRCPI